jgi:hypothetical protein
VDDSAFAGWKRLEFFDGARKLGEIGPGPAQWLVEKLQAGLHAYSVLGTDSHGQMRPSQPVLVVVQGN